MKRSTTTATLLSFVVLGGSLAAFAVATTPDEDLLPTPMELRPIDPELFDARGADLRSFTKEAVIQAPVETVWAAWTDGRAFTEIYGRDNDALVANIDLAIGGRYEWLFDGEIGSNGCQILSYVPNRMLSFSWNAPPQQPESRAKHTWVVVELDPVEGGATRVTLTHLGFGDAPHWDESFEYFSKAWPHVLEQFRTQLES